MIHACCHWPTLRHANTCHYCGAIEVPMHPQSVAAVGEPLCDRCYDGTQQEGN